MICPQFFKNSKSTDITEFSLFFRIWGYTKTFQVKGMSDINETKTMKYGYHNMLQCRADKTNLLNNSIPEQHSHTQMQTCKKMLSRIKGNFP